MKTLAVVALGATLICSAVAAQPWQFDPSGQSLDARIARVGDGIHLNTSNGVLTPNLAHSAFEDLDNIKATENNWRSAQGGHLTREQWHDLSRRLVILEHKVHYSEEVNGAR
jgi:hypothetical protein